MVNGAYSQPFLRTLSGESVLHQFDHELSAIERALGVMVTSYASQEPCFCPQLPQILSGYGIQQALVRTHWAPFGEEAAHDALLVNWEGPDGSAVRAVPRQGWMDYETRRDLYPGALRANLTGSQTSEWTEAKLGRMASGRRWLPRRQPIVCQRQRSVESPRRECWGPVGACCASKVRVWS